MDHFEESRNVQQPQSEVETKANEIKGFTDSEWKQDFIISVKA